MKHESASRRVESLHTYYLPIQDRLPEEAPTQRPIVDKESRSSEERIVGDCLSFRKFTIRRRVHPPQLFYLQER